MIKKNVELSTGDQEQEAYLEIRELGCKILMAKLIGKSSI